MIEQNDSSTPKGGLNTIWQTNDQIEARIKSSSLNTKFVRILKLALPLIAASLVVVLFVWSDDHKVAPPPSKKDIVPDQVGQNKLLNPRFESEDSKSRPYVVTATEATQTPDQPSVVNLLNPAAVMDVNPTSKINVKSDKGMFDQVKQILHLNENVHFTNSGGYLFNMKQVDIDLISQTSKSDMPVDGNGPMGSVEAAAFEADAARGIVIFKGPVCLVIQPQPSKNTEINIQNLNDKKGVE